MGMRVDLDDLGRKSAAIRTELANMPQAGAQGQIAPPSAHQVSTESATRLGLASLVVWMYQAWGIKEGERLAASLEATRAAYQGVDTASQQALDSDGNQAITVMTQPVPPPPVPAPPGRIPSPPPIAPGGFATPVIVQQQLDAGDQGSSLRHYSDVWSGVANQIRGSAPAFEARTGDWEGLAADAAYAKFNSYRGWLDELATSWEELSKEASRLADVHRSITDAHRPIAAQYEQAEKKLADATDGAQVAALFAEMQSAQAVSEELIGQYAAGMSPKVVQPEDPPNSGLDPTAATRDPDAQAPQDPTRSSGTPGAPGGAPRGGPPTAAEPTPAPTSAAQKAAGGAPAGGGAPSGSGAPSGGAPGGMPGGLPGGGTPTGAPKLPTDPSLKPAADGGGAGAGGGGAGGGAGGGGTSMPLSPAVSAETVAPTAPTHAASTAPAAASTGSAAGGAMGGGMAPMGHGGAHNQGKEKRRDPNLAPDEDLYSEDRPWTEAVIGNRRRRDVQDKEAT